MLLQFSGFGNWKSKSRTRENRGRALRTDAAGVGHPLRNAPVGVDWPIVPSQLTLWGEDELDDAPKGYGEDRGEDQEDGDPDGLREKGRLGIGLERLGHEGELQSEVVCCLEPAADDVRVVARVVTPDESEAEDGCHADDEAEEDDADNQREEGRLGAGVEGFGHQSSKERG